MNLNNILIETFEQKLSVQLIDKKKNSINMSTLRELEEIINFGYENKAIKGITITGVGNTSFIAVADIKEFLDLTPEKGEELSKKWSKSFKVNRRMPKANNCCY